MDNEIQKLKTTEDNLKSKASQQHDYKNAELRRSEDGKNPELKGDDGKLLKTHNVCLNTVAGLRLLEQREECVPSANHQVCLAMLRLQFLRSFQPFCSFLRLSIHASTKLQIPET
ncbi:hypothetical protein MTR67_011849 [Solanum verrucosum]|uniref:Uncharacterized protein n=1 Tax=Solanum verrucosum TaxID=315347 RepID=A0AAF0Q7K6_SOLVR|nr:hypothetical protein MTR67_011849 [Solanum verrucosum]